MTFSTLTDQQIFNDPHWRDKLTRETHAALMRADSSRSYVKSAYTRLSSHIARMPDTDALEAYKRVLRVMGAFAALTPIDRDALDGQLPFESTYRLSGTEAVHLRAERQRQVWQSHPDLAAYHDEIDADAERAAQAQRQQIEDHKARLQETERGWAEAPGFVLALHGRGIHLSVQDGRARAFPAAHLTGDELGFLTAHNSAVATAILASWTA